MTYALGMQLSADAVRVATMSDPSAYDGPFEVHPPVLYCDGGSTWVGAAAVSQGAARPQALVQDVVGQFTVDRLFLTAGRMLSTDDALRELMWGIVAGLTEQRQAAPQAVTISCPPSWGAETQARVGTITQGLRLALPRVVGADDCYVAAADAFSRLPQRATVAAMGAPEVPDLESSFRRPVPVAAAAPVITPHATAIGSPRRAIIGSALAVIALLAVLGFVLLRNSRETKSPSTTSVPTSAGMVVVFPSLFLPPR